jgi:hypothetical protein
MAAIAYFMRSSSSNKRISDNMLYPKDTSHIVNIYLSSFPASFFLRRVYDNKSRPISDRLTDLIVRICIVLGKHALIHIHSGHRFRLLVDGEIDYGAYRVFHLPVQGIYGLESCM